MATTLDEIRERRIKPKMKRREVSSMPTSVDIATTEMKNSMETIFTLASIERMADLRLISLGFCISPLHDLANPDYHKRGEDQTNDSCSKGREVTASIIEGRVI